LLSSYNTRFVGKVSHYLESTASTNEFALQLTKKEVVAEGTVVWTDDQYGGKGQMGNTWHSAPGMNLTTSVVLCPKFLPPHRIYLLNMLVATAIRETIGLHLKNVKIKWPNDIYIGSEKIAGILIENVLSGGKILNSIIGVGLNVNQEKFPEALPNPTSLALQTGNPFEVEEVLSQLLWKLEQQYLKLVAGDTDEIKENYMSHLLYLNETRALQTKTETFKGRIVDVTENGRLVVESAGGRLEFDSKEVLF